MPGPDDAMVWPAVIDALAPGAWMPQVVPLVPPVAETHWMVALAFTAARPRYELPPLAAPEIVCDAVHTVSSICAVQLSPQWRDTSRCS